MNKELSSFQILQPSGIDVHYGILHFEANFSAHDYLIRSDSDKDPHVINGMNSLATQAGQLLNLGRNAIQHILPHALQKVLFILL